MRAHEPDGRIYHWDTSTQRILAQACTMAGRDLTPTEWAQSFGDRPYRKTC